MTTPRTQPVDDFTVFLPFTKVSEVGDGTIRVHSVINDETVDDQGEILDYAGTKAALDDFMKWANVREMHQASAVGVVESITHDDLAKTSEGILHIVDASAVSKVLAKVYKGTSLGGGKGTIRVMEKVAGKTATRLKAPVVNELSLVDRPSRPTAELTLLKRSDVAEEVPVSVETPAVEAAAPAPATEPVTEPASAQAEPEAGVDAPEADAAVTEAPVAAAAELAPAAEAAAATETPAEPEKPLEQAAKTGDLAKTATEDVGDLTYALNSINRAAEHEAEEGDTAGADALRAIAAALVTAIGVEAAEVGTPADVAEAAADKPIPVVIVDPFYYAAVTGDLAKRAVILAKAGGTAPEPDPQLDTLVSLAKAAGGRCEHDIEASTGAAPEPSAEVLAKIADATLERAGDSLMQKVSQAIGPMVRPDELEAMKGEVLGILGSMKEQLAKIAAQPASGGPARYATDPRRFGPDGENGLTPAIEAEVLRKVADSATDPSQKEALGLAAATALIRADRG